MSRLNICLLGGTGFVGHNLATDLVNEGHRVRVLTRRRERHRDMLVLPTLTMVSGSVHDLAFLRSQFQGMDVVINLVGILNQTRGKGRSFRDAHLELPRKIMDSIKQTGVKRYLHMSALGVGEKGRSEYLRTKTEAENMVHDMAADSSCAVTSFRPSVIFGKNDSFTNRFADLLRKVPFVFPLACPDSKFQPIFVDDVSACFVAALNDHHCFDQRYNLCGPRSYTLQEIVEYLARVIGAHRRIIRLTDWQSRLQARVMGWMPGKPFSYDNYLSLQLDSVCPGPFPADFDITPTPMEDVVPAYLRPRHQRLDEARSVAGR